MHGRELKIFGFETFIYWLIDRLTMLAEST
jgi:hypothetical protein